MIATKLDEARVIPPRTSERRGQILLVDDDAVLRRTYQRVLRADGYDVQVACGGEEALPLARVFDFDVVLSDISMPGMDGIGLLRALRAAGSDVPVVLMTAGASLETAMSAVELGAVRYLTKPLDIADIETVLEQIVAQARATRARRHMLGRLGEAQLGNLATINERFECALESLWMAFQPIVDWSGRRVFGYEALLRSRESSLPHPGAMLEAAEQLERLPELSRTIRTRVAAAVVDAPPDCLLFVNLHSLDLLDDDLYSRSAALYPHAKRVVFEITERESFDRVKDVRARLASLRALGYRIAVDDLGAGYAGLTSFVQLEPEVVKIDMSLVRDVDTSELKQKLIRSLATVCIEAGRQVVVEGIETVAERETLGRLGCTLYQGYLLARPGAGFPAVTW